MIEEIMVDVGENSGVTVFDIVGFAQKHLKGQHFEALRVRLDGRWLHFESCEYQGQLNEKEIPGWVKCLGTDYEPPCFFEHFLQSVRKKFPGVSFDQIKVESTLNWQRVWVEFSNSAFLFKKLII